ncbi:MAG: hypothetical protein GX020_00950 [Firmicutes bacterium]|jgi:hypothetical protein|nr:hypothetical protein [Bacillota bacterium]
MNKGRSVFVLVLLMLVLGSNVLLADVKITAYLYPRDVQIETEVTAKLLTDLNLHLGVTHQGLMEKDSLKADLTTYALDYSFGSTTIFAGRQSFTFGKARINSLFFGNERARFPHIGYEINGKNWSYQKIYGDLAIDDNLKRLGAHYLDITPIPELSIGIGEALITHDTFPGDYFYYALPILPYYLANYVPGTHSTSDNSLFYGDFELRLPPTTLYGELLVTEFPMVPGAKNPDLWGITLGLETSKLVPNWVFVVEFARAQNFLYSNSSNLRGKDTSLSIGETPLGNPFGPDFQTVQFQAKREWEQGLDLEAGVFYRALGESNVTWWYKNRQEYEENRFLAGTPEYQIGMKTNLAYPIVENMVASFDLEVARANNYKHQEGKTGYYYAAIITAHWKF